ncbi:SCP-like protein [Teladorsagia circumcincta]|uniref:SCP-like protein n=1 Tax=Teladorsagia circumcincta TaxID=45464 RepID=A0A2G9U6W2_TELCI|nr:SCP-like protein [Teladorsagia circumcincta]
MSTTPAMTTSTTSSARVSTTTATTNSSSDPITDAIREKIIDMHNYRRSRLAQGLVPNGMTGKNCAQGMNLYSMIYDTDLENEAQQYANSCPLSGSSPESRTSGENFAAIPSSSATTYYDAVYQAIKEFWREIKVNADGVNEAMVFTDVLRYKTLAPLRFTQMAWANTYQVGCGARQCGENTVVVCRYNPRGNIVGENIYDVGPTCGECFDICTTAYLYKGLCPAP